MVRDKRISAKSVKATSTSGQKNVPYQRVSYIVSLIYIQERPTLFLTEVMKSQSLQEAHQRLNLTAGLTFDIQALLDHLEAQNLSFKDIKLIQSMHGISLESVNDCLALNQSKYDINSLEKYKKILEKFTIISHKSSVLFHFSCVLSQIYATETLELTAKLYQMMNASFSQMSQAISATVSVSSSSHSTSSHAVVEEEDEEEVDVFAQPQEEAPIVNAPLSAGELPIIAVEEEDDEEEDEYEFGAYLEEGDDLSNDNANDRPSTPIDQPIVANMDNTPDGFTRSLGRYNLNTQVPVKLPGFFEEALQASSGVSSGNTVAHSSSSVSPVAVTAPMSPIAATTSILPITAPSKNKCSAFSFYHLDCVLVSFFMSRTTQNQAAHELNISTPSLSHFFAKRKINFEDLRLINCMLGVSVNKINNVAQNAYIPFLPKKSTASLSIAEQIEKYKALFEKVGKVNDSQVREFFDLARVIAAVCSASTIEDAASLLEMSVEGLQLYLQVNDSSFIQMNAYYQTFLTTVNIRSKEEMEAVGEETCVGDDYLTSAAQAPVPPLAAAYQSNLPPTTFFMADLGLDYPNDPNIGSLGCH